MIIRNVDELLVVVDRFIADRQREFRTAMLLHEDDIDLLDALADHEAEILARWRAEMRDRLAEMGFPLTLRWSAHDHRDVE